MSTSSQQHVQLEQFYYGKWWEDGVEKSDFRITACSKDLSLRKAEQLFFETNFGSPDRKDLARLQHGYGLLQADAQTYLLLHIRPGPRPSRTYIYPDYRCIVVPTDVLVGLAGNLQPLYALLDNEKHLPELPVGVHSLPSVELTVKLAPPTVEIESLQTSLHEFNNKLDSLAQLLSALITQRPVAVLDAPSDPVWRWAMCQALLLLLPPPLRQQWTFATEVFDGSCHALLKFLYKDPYIRAAANDSQYRWQEDEFRPRLQSVHLYAQFIVQHWNQGAGWLIDTLHDQEVIAIVDQLKVCPLQDVLAILADRLTILPSVKQGKAQHQNWSTIQRLLTKQLGQVSQLAPAAADWLINDTQMIMHQLTEQGFGDRTYQFLEKELRGANLDWLRWRSTLEQIALKYLGQSHEESDLLAFVDQVQQTQEGLSDTFWNDLIDTLRPACEKSPKVTRALLNLWLAHETTSDYKDFLLDANVTAQFPADLAALRRYWLDPTPETRERPVSLVAISKKLPHSAPRFFLDMVQETIQRQTFALIDKNAVYYLAKLARQPEHKNQILQLVNQLPATKEQLLAEEVLTELPRLLIELTEIDQALDLLAHLAQLPQLEKEFPLLLGDLCRTADLPNPLDFLEKLEQMPVFGKSITSARLGLLDRSDWSRVSAARDKMTDWLKRITQVYVESVLDDSSPWSTKATKLNELQSKQAVISVVTLLPHIGHTINQYALEKLKPAEIRNVSAEFGKYCPDLLEQSRLDVLASFVDTFGSHRVQNIIDSVATTVRLLKNLEKILRSWDKYAAEFRSQINTLPLEKQEQFAQNCNYLLTFFPTQLEVTSGPVDAFRKLLVTVEQQLRPTPTSNESPQKSWWKKW